VASRDARRLGEGVEAGLTTREPRTHIRNG
jgi:hypothetical protein